MPDSRRGIGGAELSDSLLVVQNGCLPDVRSVDRQKVALIFTSLKLLDAQKGLHSLPLHPFLGKHVDSTLLDQDVLLPFLALRS